MKIFISHSWKNITIAHMFYTDVKRANDAWWDMKELFPGDRIQKDIDKAIAGMDFVAVLWSTEAAASDGVREEIKAALKEGIPMVFCLLERECELPANVKEEEPLCVRLGPAKEDYSLGYAQFCVGVMKGVGTELGVGTEDDDKLFNETGKILMHLNDLLNDKNTTDAERGYWLGKMYSSMKDVDDRGGSILEKIGEEMAFVKLWYRRLNEASSDRAMLQDLLQEVIRNEHKAPKMCEDLRVVIEMRIAELPDESSRSEEAPMPAAPAVAPRVSQAQKSLGAVAEGVGGEIEEWLRGRVPDQTLGATVALLEYYIETMRESLETLGGIATATQSPAAMQVVHHLMSYLEDPNDLLPESVHGAWGYLDDAWLIHNVAYRLVEAGIIPANAFPLDWSRIMAADPVAVACLPQMVRYQLENYLNQLLVLISNEINSYVPQFVHGGGTYHPYMADAGVVDADSALAETSAEYVGAAMAGMSLDCWG